MGTIVCTCGKRISDAVILRHKLSTLISNYHLEEASISNDPYIAAESKGKTVYHCDCGNIGITSRSTVVWYSAVRTGQI